ncbi:MAG TPA: hypothetical protein VNW52_04610, partial [Burkholderiaceae bacterium]|nr:hypothetical protein [Burkholderiaceae bacterium]
LTRAAWPEYPWKSSFIETFRYQQLYIFINRLVISLAHTYKFPLGKFNRTLCVLRQSISIPPHNKF